MNYRDELTRAMDKLAADERTCFLGYGVKIGGKALGTLKNVSDAQLIETTVAENLMAGMAHGLALIGRLPVVFIERADFIFNALDAIVNHCDKAQQLSRGQFTAGVIFRVVVGNKYKPLFTGETHTQNPADAMRSLLGMTVEELESPADIAPMYAYAHARAKTGRPTMLFEFKDLI